MSVAVLPGCEAQSHVAGSSCGVLVLHGFTGNPSSMRGVATTMIAADLDVELPRLPGHGTTVEDMIATDWTAWIDEVESARAQLASRCDAIVVVGQSMGGTLALRAAFDHPSTDGLVLINPATRPRDDEVMAMLDEFIADGLAIVPGEGSDIADPDSTDISYDGTPLAPLRSLVHDGIAPMSDRYSELTMPLRLFTSRQDHVVEPADSEYLAAQYGGEVEHTWLDRSFHVATRDYDRGYIEAESLSFVRRIAGLAGATGMTGVHA